MFLNFFLAELRRKYKLISLITASFVVVGVSLGINADEKWNSKALLIAPTYNQTASLFSVMSSLTALGAGVGFNSLSQEDIFEEFKFEINNIDNKKEYLKSSGIKIKSSSDADNIIKIIESVDNKLIEITFVSGTASDAKLKLDGYLYFVKNKVNESLSYYIENITVNINEVLKLKQSVLDRTAYYKLNNEIEKLKVSNAITKKAGLNKPIINPGISMALPLSLGNDVIKNQLYEYENNKYNIYKKDFEVKSKLELLRGIENKKINIFPYRVEIKPTLPEYKSSPSIIKYTILSLIVSMVISLIVLLLGVRNDYLADLK